MNFRTILEPSKSDLKINHQYKLMMLGSCFTNSIGEKLRENKFDALVNPFGTLYNPISIKKALEISLDDKVFNEADIFEDKGLYNSFYFHSSFSCSDKVEFLKRINDTTTSVHARLKEANILFITFGTSYIYEDISTNEIVGNCHKLPTSNFRRYRLSVERIVEAWSEMINRLTKINPKLQIIFTVSPIRHLRDGAHDNQLSKAVLLLAIEKLTQQFKQTSYFPSYEIVLDDLRDYRFYEIDMCHPNSLAIHYIWEKFGEIYFEQQTIITINKWLKIKQDLDHKPFNPQSKEYMHFLKQSLLKLDKFKSEYPFICVHSEIENIKGKINSLHF